MILVAAAAAAIAWTQVVFEESFRRANNGWPWSTWPYSSFIYFFHPAAVPPLMTTTIALALLRLRRPRPAWRRLARKPGAVACGVAASALAIQWMQVMIGKCLYRILNMIPNMPPVPTSWTIAVGLSDVGLAVIGAWLVLASGRRWGAEPSWIDRLGRLLGACWIGLFLIHHFMLYTVIL
jgi:hypothetical protein